MSSSVAKKSPSEDEVPLLLRYGAQGFAIFSGIVAIVFGAWNCFGVIVISVLGVASGIFSICMGIMVIANETRICGVYQRFDGVEFNRNKAIGYSIAAFPAFPIYPSLSSFVASVLIFITGIIYAIISFLEHKHQKPQQPQQPQQPYQSIPVNAYKAPYVEVAVNLAPVEVISTIQPAKNQEVDEQPNDSKPSIDHVEPIYPSLNV